MLNIMKLLKQYGTGAKYGMHWMRAPQGTDKEAGQVADESRGGQVQASGDAIVIADGLHHIAEAVHALTREIKTQGEAVALSAEDAGPDTKPALDMSGKPIRY